MKNDNNKKTKNPPTQPQTLSISLKNELMQSETTQAGIPYIKSVYLLKHGKTALTLVLVLSVYLKHQFILTMNILGLSIQEFYCSNLKTRVQG